MAKAAKSKSQPVEDTAPTQETSARPGTEDTTAKAPNAEASKVRYPGIEEDAEGKITKTLSETPKDFNPKVHKALRKRDFDDEWMYNIFLAEGLEARAASLRAEAEEIKKLGSKEDRKKAKKLMTLKARMDELQASLTEEGIDVDALLNAVNG